jgi:23S rRNA (uridine2552-2'-O)-methyltransferase
MPQHAEARVGDVFELTVEELGGMFQVLISDMAPSTTGNRVTDHLRSAGLVERALDLALRCLEPGGSVVAKLLEGAEIEPIVRRMREEYEKVQRFRPKATRQESTEVFLVGLRKRAVEAE